MSLQNDGQPESDNPVRVAAGFIVRAETLLITRINPREADVLPGGIRLPLGCWLGARHRATYLRMKPTHHRDPSI